MLNQRGTVFPLPYTEMSSSVIAPMILLAESGASKTEWRALRRGQLLLQRRGEGLNPNTLSPEALQQRLRQQLSEFPVAEVAQLWFWGAGLGQAVRRAEMRSHLKALLPQAEIHLGDDLEAAVQAHALDAGIALLLGTGSNAGRFAQGRVQARAGGLGYLLGDEGGGADLGRALLRGILMPGWRTELQQQLLQELQQDRAGLIAWLYGAPRPAQQLASLTHLITRHATQPEVDALLQARFGALLDQTVRPLMPPLALPLTATGSIAFHFQAQLERAVEARGWRLVSVEKAPIEALTRRFLAGKRP